MRWTNRRSISTRHMGSCDCRTRCASCCRCVLPAGHLNDELCIRLTLHAGEAPGEAKRFPLRPPGKHGYAQSAPSRWSATAPVAARRAGGKRWFMGAVHAEGDPNRATLRFLLLPPCFPGFSAEGGEAKTAPKGRS